MPASLLTNCYALLNEIIIMLQFVIYACCNVVIKQEVFNISVFISKKKNDLQVLARNRLSQIYY